MNNIAYNHNKDGNYEAVFQNNGSFPEFKYKVKNKK